MPEPALRFLTLGMDLTDEEQSLLENVHETLDKLTQRRKGHLSISSGLDAVLREVILYRVVMMAGGTIVNWNTGNVLCSFLSARALFETFAFLWDYDRAINEARKAGTLAEFEKLTANRLAATRNPKRIEKNPEWESTNILTAIGRLSEEHPWAKTAYDLMSYRCHPNTEGMFETFADLDAETGTVNFSTHNDTAGWAFRIILGVTALMTNAEKIFDRLEDATPKIADELRDRDFRKLVAQSEREQEQFEQFGEDERQAFIGDARGQFAIGRVFSTGIPTIPKNLMLAHCWRPAGRYLLRMAKSSDARARALIATTLRNVAASTHPDVQQMGMEILAALPPAEAAPLVNLAEQWLTPDARFIMAQAPHDLIRGLAQGGEDAAALRTTRAVFKVFSENGRLATLFSRHMYEHHLPDAVKAIAPVCKAEAVALLADLLDQAVRISGKVTDDPLHDYTYYLSGEVSEHGTKHDAIDALVGEIVRSSKLAIEADPTCTRDVVSRIRSHSAKIFTRIALHVLSLNPGGAPDVAQACLTDRDLIEATWCRVEYGELARTWFPSLPAPIQQEILAYVDSMPDKYRDRFNERFEQHEKRPPTSEEQRSRDDSVVRDLLWQWREVLPADRREAVEKLGDPDAWRERMYEPAKSPLAAPDFSARPIDEIVTFLETWRPAAGEKHETATALAQEVREAAMGNAALYSANAARFAQLPPIYVRRVLEAFRMPRRTRTIWTGAACLH